MRKVKLCTKNVVWDKAERIIQKSRPYIQAHGGDVRLIEIKAETAFLKIDGVCVNCPLANLTYNKVLGALLIEGVPEIKKIKIIK